MTTQKYDAFADSFTEREYGDPERYFRRRAEIVVAGIVGALLSVPFAACVNSVVRHLASDEPPDTDGLLGEESRDLGEPPPVTT